MQDIETSIQCHDPEVRPVQMELDFSDEGCASGSLQP